MFLCQLMLALFAVYYQPLLLPFLPPIKIPLFTYMQQGPPGSFYFLLYQFPHLPIYLNMVY
ncbi:hypothetical protein AM501_21405 [Aneurinibacillus migulanus]|nr:hypothetical protein TS64_27945 [Aneurinibacillus migulanus]KPD06467.1 hypothetical protein AM501_21405 [Aneurinibacillus migulanus]